MEKEKKKEEEKAAKELLKLAEMEKEIIEQFKQKQAKGGSG